MVFGVVNEAKPKYILVRALSEGAELRSYAPMVVAQVEWAVGSSGPEQAEKQEKPFFLLARYIGVFGKPENTGDEAVAMTAPVMMGTAPQKMAMTAPVLLGSTAEAGSEETREFMRFVLPSSYTVETAPTPSNPRVQILAVPAKLVAALGFSGGRSKAWTDRHGAILLEALAAAGLKPVSDELEPWVYAGFNPPFTLPMFRMNEVYIDVTEGGAPSAAQLQHAAQIPRSTWW